MESYHETANGSNVDICVEADEPRERFLEPVTCGLPWPRGKLREDSYLILRNDHGEQVPLQTRILDRWPDGSVRWLLLDWQATVKGSARYQLCLLGDDVASAGEGLAEGAKVQGGIQIERKGSRMSEMTIATGAAQFHLRRGGEFPFESIDLPESQSNGSILAIPSVQHELGFAERLMISDLQVVEQGPLKVCLRLGGDIHHRFPYPFAKFEAYLYFFAGSSSVRVLWSICNPQRAKHPGGMWCLGDKRSIFLRDVSFTIKLSEFHAQLKQLEQEIKTITSKDEFQKMVQLSRLGQIREAYDVGAKIDFKKFLLLTGQEVRLSYQDRDLPREWAKAGTFRCSLEIHTPPTEGQHLYQDSSGASNWQSSNHVNRHGVVPNAFSGYRLRTSRDEQSGQRATPIVTLQRDGLMIGLAMKHFWQNFPKAIEAGVQSLTLRLFPRQYADVHELQAGEQKTHEFVVAFGKDTVTSDPLAWVRSPLRVRAEPAWYCSTGAVPYLTPEADDPNTDYIRLVRSAIEGEDTFEKKRELVDEYGWRNFGDIYADHEAVNHQGPKPLVSHYNNQYDPLAGFAYQFMRSGDWRWWSAMEELATHVIDIDIYHTDQDKAAYNHGLFWHTVHYTDAGLSTHRSYPRAPGVRGGGPGNEHNYTTGLMLHYFLTGNPQSRQAAIDLAQWVIDMDDGTKTVFRWLDRGDTGLASATVSPLYHGPGRGAGNSIQALLDGHRLTGDPKFLAKAEQLIRRCIHPADDIAARNLLDAERRWSYTVFLQALGRYLDYKAELDKIDAMYAYARAALLHYARWMADNEYPYLEKPEILEYPTETWAAQDMRKSEVFKFAAKHTALAERERFLERSEFFFRYVTKTLTAMKTRTLARPVVILLSNGFMHAYFQKHPEVAAPAHRWVYYDVGKPEVFVPQKIRARKRFLALLGAAVFIGILGLLFTLL